MTVHTGNFQRMVRFFLFLALAIVFYFSVGTSLSISLAADPADSTPQAPLQGPLLAQGSSALAKESSSQDLPTAPGSSNLNDEAVHSNLVSEVDKAIQLPERSGARTHTRDTSHPPALMELFNYPIAIFRGSLYGYTPAQREQANEARLDQYLEEEYSGVITTEQRAEGIMILIDGKNAFMLIPDDVDPFAGLTLEEYVEEVVKLLNVALTNAKEQRSTPYLLRATGLSLLATFVFGLLIWGVNFLQHRVRPHILQLENTFHQKMRQRRFFILVHLGSMSFWLIRVVFWVLLLGLALKWLSFCLQQFPYTRYWGDQLDDNFLAFLGEAVRAIVEALPDLLIIAVIVLATRGVVWLAQAFFAGVESGRVHVEWMDLEAARATKRIVIVVIWLFALVMIFPYIPGSDSDAFKGVSIFVGLLVSLGSAGVIGQFTSGLVLMYSHALKPGEYVQIGEHEGTVGTLGFLSTKIHTKKNEEVHVPNTVILSATVKNYSRLAKTAGVLLYTTVTIGYNTPWRQVHAMLLEAADWTAGLLKQPIPFVMQTALSDFYVEYQLNANIQHPDERLKVLAELHTHIQDVFNEHEVQIMSPHYLMDPPQPAIAPRDTWYSTPAPPPDTSLPPTT
jgi:small-conductance mechanosensitive channel